MSVSTANTQWWVRERRFDPLVLCGDGTVVLRRITRSLLYYCPQCGDSWARVHVWHPEASWLAYPRPCLAHGLGLLFPSERHNPHVGIPYWLIAREVVLAAELGTQYFAALTGATPCQVSPEARSSSSALLAQARLTACGPSRRM